MAESHAEKEPPVPAGKGCDVSGSPSGWSELPAACDIHRCLVENHPSLDSASQGESQSSDARNAATGIFWPNMSAWRSDLRGRITMDLPLVRCNGDARSPSLPPRDERRRAGEAQRAREVQAQAAAKAQDCHCPACEASRIVDEAEAHENQAAQNLGNTKLWVADAFMILVGLVAITLIGLAWGWLK